MSRDDSIGNAFFAVSVVTVSMNKKTLNLLKLLFIDSNDKLYLMLPMKMYYAVILLL